jgi:hypothetical protein
VEISSLLIRGTGAAKRGIAIYNATGTSPVADQLKIDKVAILGFNDWQLYARYCDLITITNSWFGEYGNAAYFAKCNPILISHSCFSDAHRKGIQIDTSYNIQLVGNLLARCGDDTGKYAAITLNRVGHASLTGNDFFENNCAIELRGGTNNVNISGGYIDGNGLVANSDKCGIRIRDAYSSNISGLTITAIDTGINFVNGSSLSLWTNVSGVKIDSCYRSVSLDANSGYNTFKNMSYNSLRPDTGIVDAGTGNIFESDSKSLTFDNGASSDAASFPWGTTASEYDWAWTSDPGTPGACWITAGSASATLTCKAAVTGTPTWKITRKK